MTQLETSLSLSATQPETSLHVLLCDTVETNPSFNMTQPCRDQLVPLRDTAGDYPVPLHDTARD